MPPPADAEAHPGAAASPATGPDPARRRGAPQPEAGAGAGAGGKGVLDEIRRRCREVSEAATLVRIDPAAIRPYAAALLDAGMVGAARPSGEPHGTAAPPETPDGTDPGSVAVVGDPWSVAGQPGDRAGRTAAEEATAALVLTLATVNFGSGYHDHVRKRPGCSGAVTMAAAVRDWAAAEPITSARLVGVTAADAHGLFDQPTHDAAVAELMALFAQALHDLGSLVADDFGGSFAALVRAAQYSAERLVAVLARLSFFRDVQQYAGTAVPFYKRAQLAAADLDRAFSGQGLGRFDDLDRLTAFADNLVPHVLRIDGILHLDPSLSAQIDAGVPVPAGSPAEVEIRAGGVHAVELLRGELAAAGVFERSSDLDALLWGRGRAARYKAVSRHRTRSVFY